MSVVSRPLGIQTNNVAEYTGLVLALREAQRLGARSIDLRLDSKLIVEQLHGLEYMPPEYNAYNAAEVDHLVDALQALIYTTEELTNECHG